MEKTMTKEIAIKMIASKEESLRELALLHYPELVKKVRSYEHACEILGRKPKNFVSSDKKEEAFLKLKTIIEAYNSLYSGGKNFPIYYPVFELDELGNMQVFDSVRSWTSCASVPAPFPILFRKRL